MGFNSAFKGLKDKSVSYDKWKSSEIYKYLQISYNLFGFCNTKGFNKTRAKLTRYIWNLGVIDDHN